MSRSELMCQACLGKRPVMRDNDELYIFDQINSSEKHYSYSNLYLYDGTAVETECNGQRVGKKK